jgi:hypothetical protein
VSVVAKNCERVRCTAIRRPMTKPVFLQSNGRAVTAGTSSLVRTELDGDISRNQSFCFGYPLSLRINELKLA